MGDGRVSRLNEIELAIARAWPADETVDIGGWLWRCSGGGFGRANSVATLGGPPGDVDTALREIEQRYEAAGQTSLIQVTDASLPPDIGQLLTDRGYVASETNATLLADLGVMPVGNSPSDLDDVEISDTATADWIATYGSVLSPARLASAPRILARVPSPRRMIGVRRAGQMVATVLLVADGPIGVIECVATLAGARRTGAARSAMHTAIAEARRLNLRSIALSMVAANAPARHLYTSLGFVDIGRNRYFERNGGVANRRTAGSENNCG